MGCGASSARVAPTFLVINNNDTPELRVAQLVQTATRTDLLCADGAMWVVFPPLVGEPAPPAESPVPALPVDVERSIRADLLRTFPWEPRMQAPAGYPTGVVPDRLDALSDSLRAVHALLSRYAALDPPVGYCQGMNFVAGFLVLQGAPLASGAAVLRGLLLRCGLRLLYAPGLHLARLLVVAIAHATRATRPRLAARLRQKAVHPHAYALAWVMSLYTDDSVLDHAEASAVWAMLLMEAAAGAASSQQLDPGRGTGPRPEAAARAAASEAARSAGGEDSDAPASVASPVPIAADVGSRSPDTLGRAASIERAFGELVAALRDRPAVLDRVAPLIVAAGLVCLDRAAPTLLRRQSTSGAGATAVVLARKQRWRLRRRRRRSSSGGGSGSGSGSGSALRLGVSARSIQRRAVSARAALRRALRRELPTARLTWLRLSRAVVRDPRPAVLDALEADALAPPT